jgi:hypothetical protein
MLLIYEGILTVPQYETLKALADRRIEILTEFIGRAESGGEVMQLRALVLRYEEALRKIADLAEDAQKTHYLHLQKGISDERPCISAWGLEKILNVALRALESGQ